MMSLPQGELYANLVFYFYWRKDLHPDFESFQFKAQMQALGSLGCMEDNLITWANTYLSDGNY